ncbi:predicted protein [Pyrenophora tritici-repentis Pt-1C-BFP]|uniref:Uncharacterized protein n=1 Tax=Pyrenophora tritici-repentis (strain Pt-1C-BFP) TaxID=426418 RepID=B2WPL4_PYRTR|nr:uncharacterized protein PTRG_11965 [Pyrenophora tritici-repentis Pt-1C-BFP]EDU46080.1 predicted protein [Pyrenophora tritici-repentis Pt-1C-BFP]
MIVFTHHIGDVDSSKRYQMELKRARRRTGEHSPNSQHHRHGVQSSYNKNKTRKQAS